MAVINGDQFSVVSWTPDATATPPVQHVLEGFIDALPPEWKTQNVISALMLSYVYVLQAPSILSPRSGIKAILTMLQIDVVAADPISPDDSPNLPRLCVDVFAVRGFVCHTIRDDA
ncbi:hypothetical protein B0H14DRAFT_3515755 [Mycena olivaceomarginata]|nr:hypothetical protein B0H14DRAFT_3515755 [Mycena olivaceomarginata]